MEGEAWGIVYVTTRSLYVPMRWRSYRGASITLADMLRPYPEGHVWRKVLRAERVPLAARDRATGAYGARLLDKLRPTRGGAPPEHGCMEPARSVIARELGACQDADDEEGEAC